MTEENPTIVGQVQGDRELMHALTGFVPAFQGEDAGRSGPRGSSSAADSQY